MMNPIFRRIRGLPAAAALSLATLLGACDTGSVDIDPGPLEMVVVLNSVGNSLTVYPLDGRGGRFDIGLGAQGSPTTMAVRGPLAVVPMGTYPFVAVVDLVDRQVSYVALPAGSGATGVAFANDSIAVVANSSLNSVTPVNVLRGTAGAQVPVGRFPQAVAAGGGRVFVMNGELANFAPDGPGKVTVLTEELQPVGTVTLTGQNPGAGVFAGGNLFVAQAGAFGVEDGGLSVVSPSPVAELAHFGGLGDFPGSVAASPSGLIYVAVYEQGIAIFNAQSGTFVRGGSAPAGAVLPSGAEAISAVAVDSRGTLFAVNPEDCSSPGVLYQMTVVGDVVAAAETGVCPFAIGFGVAPED